MPHRHRSKQQVSEKCHKARDDAQSHGVVQITAAAAVVVFTATQKAAAVEAITVARAQSGTTIEAVSKVVAPSKVAKVATKVSQPLPITIEAGL